MDEANDCFGEMPERALAKRGPLLKELLLSDEARTDDLVLPRCRLKLRPPVEIE